MNRNDIMHFLMTHKQEMQERYGVTQIGLFGSYALETAREDSDIDLVIEFRAEKKTLSNFMGCKRYLENNLGKPIDLGIESTLKPIVRNNVKHSVIYA